MQTRNVELDTMSSSLLLLRLQYEQKDVSAVQYLNDLQHLISTFEDMHLSYSKPLFFSDINQVSPVSFYLENGNWFMKSLDLNPLITQLYDAQIENISQHFKKPIRLINNVSFPQFMQKWADDNVHTIFDHAGKFNRAIQLDFSITQYILQNFIDANYTVVFNDDSNITFNRMIAFNKPLINQNSLETMWNKSLKTDPYSNLTQLSLEQNQNYSNFRIPFDFQLINISQTQQLTESQDDFELLTYFQGFFALYLYSQQFYVLQIVGFSPSNYTDGMTKLLQALTILKDQRKEMIYISLVSNGGGNPTISSLLARAISTELYPFYPKMSMMKSSLWEFSGRFQNLYWQFPLDDWLSGSSFYDYSTKIPLSSWYFDDNMIFADGFSSFFGINCSQDPSVDEQFLQFKGIGYDPNQIVVITDGLCASAAGYFTETLRQHDIGIFVGLGGNGAEFRQICQVPGGLFMGDTLYVDFVQRAILLNSSLYTQEELAFLKQFYLPHNGFLYTTMMASFGFGNKLEHELPLDLQYQSFDVVVPDAFIGIDYASVGGLRQIMAAVENLSFAALSKFGKVCEPERSEKFVVYRERDHRCLPFACAYGYFRSAAKDQFQCVMREDKFLRNFSPPDSATSVGGWRVGCIVLIVFSAALLLLCGFLLVKVYYQPRHSYDENLI